MTLDGVVEMDVSQRKRAESCQGLCRTCAVVARRLRDGAVDATLAGSGASGLAGLAVVLGLAHGDQGSRDALQQLRRAHRYGSARPRLALPPLSSLGTALAIVKGRFRFRHQHRRAQRLRILPVPLALPKLGQALHDRAPFNDPTRVTRSDAPDRDPTLTTTPPAALVGLAQNAIDRATTCTGSLPPGRLRQASPTISHHFGRNAAPDAQPRGW